MQSVNITHLRNHLQEYVARAADGETIVVMRSGKSLAVLGPAIDARDEARRTLRALRKHARVRDVVTPIDETWTAARDRR